MKNVGRENSDVTIDSSETVSDASVPLTYGSPDPTDREFPARTFMRVVYVLLCIPLIFAFFTTLPLNTPGLAYNGSRRFEIENALVLIGFVFVGAMLFVVVRCMAYPSSRRHVRLPLLAIGFMWLSCVLASGLKENTWAFKGRFAESRSELDAVVASVEKGARPAGPQMVGAFAIQEIRELPDGGIVFVTSIDQRSVWGFAYIPSDTAEEAGAEALGLTGDDVYYQGMRRLDSKWYVLFDMYTYSKRGWS
ncbi:MAG TPA: hypothetical protein P5081_20910 [Phycisphaerae bacterium]|nr:hypothetical protein [Phycisphaerae bacterium]HRW55342.1 hypothetical protein [Phycisphaerae bacterium]